MKWQLNTRPTSNRYLINWSNPSHRGLLHVRSLPPCAKSVTGASNWLPARNLSPRQIHALETDNHALLPGIAIVRGFIRAYAKLLRVDAAPILAAVKPSTGSVNALPELAPLIAIFSEIAVPFEKRNGSSVPVIVFVVVALLVILFFVSQPAGWVPAFSTIQVLPAEAERAV